MANPNVVEVGLVIGRIDGQKVVVRGYHGPDNDNAVAAYGMALALRDELERQRADKAKGVNCGPSLPFYLPVGQSPV